MSAPSPPADWTALAGAYETVIRKYAASIGQDPDSPALDTTIQTNTSLVPRRADDLLLLLRELAGVGSLEGLRVLDLGSGWGSMATYIAQQHAPAHVTCIDSRPEFVEAATECTQAAGIQTVDYRVTDMAGLEGIADNSFDLLIANNALPYVITTERLDTTVAATFRVAAPGAVLIAHQANRWQFRDPFTDEPLVHMLGRRASARVARITGWHGSHDRLRLFGPGELKRRLGAAGFADSRIGAFGPGHKIERGMRARGGRFFAVTARKP